MNRNTFAAILAATLTAFQPSEKQVQRKLARHTAKRERPRVTNNNRTSGKHFKRNARRQRQMGLRRTPGALA